MGNNILNAPTKCNIHTSTKKLWVWYVSKNFSVKLQILSFLKRCLVFHIGSTQHNKMAIHTSFYEALFICFDFLAAGFIRLLRLPRFCLREILNGQLFKSKHVRFALTNKTLKAAQMKIIPGKAQKFPLLPKVSGGGVLPFFSVNRKHS